MSDSQVYVETAADADGVSVAKRFEADEFPVPAIAFKIVSERSDAVTVRLIDTVPDDVAVEDLGFHPEYGSEFWNIDDDRLTFEREIEADSEYTTVYGIRETGIDDIHLFLTEPVIEAVETSHDERDIDGGFDPAGGDGVSAEFDSAPGLGDGEDDHVETVQLSGHNGEQATETTDEEAVADKEETVGTGNVVAAMANEIRQNTVSPQDIKLLNRALNVVSEGTDARSGVHTARLNRIQSDIADLRAYTDALDEFLAENGTGDELLEAFSERLDGFESELDSFEAEISTVTDELTSLDDDMDSLEEGLGDVEGRVTSLNRELDDLAAEIETVRTAVDKTELDERLSAVESEMSQLKEWRGRLSSVIDSAGG